jgi:hypothetical protein
MTPIADGARAGSYRKRFQRQLKATIRLLNGRQGQSILALIGAKQTDPPLGRAYSEQIARPRRAQTRRMAHQAIYAGELAPGTDPDLFLDAIMAALHQGGFGRAGDQRLHRQHRRCGLPGVHALRRQPQRHSPITTGAAMSRGTYEVYAVKYATRDGTRSANFIGGEPHDAPMPMDYFVWLIRNAERAFVVDTGFSEAMARQRKRTFLRSPSEGLALLGAEPRP